MSKKETIFDELAIAVRGCNDSSKRLNEQSEQIRNSLSELESHARKLLEFPRVLEAPEAEKILRRIERLRELRNMQEYGAFSIEISGYMDAIWQRISK
jgi:hypothetical protein